MFRFPGEYRVASRVVFRASVARMGDYRCQSRAASRDVCPAAYLDG